MHMMLRKLGIVLALVGLAAFVTSSTANAGTFAPGISELRFNLGGLPPLTLTGRASGTATLDSDWNLWDAQSIWVTTNYSGGTSAFTGVPGIDNLFFTFQNLAGHFAPGFIRPNPIGPGTIGGFGGIEPIRGLTIVVTSVLGLPIHQAAGFDLNTLSPQGGFTVAEAFPSLGVTITATGAPFFTGHVKMTAINTDLVHVTSGPRAGVTGIPNTILGTLNEMVTQITEKLGAITNELETFNVTLWGYKCITTKHGVGSIALISPTRVTTNLDVGNLPAGVVKVFRFVPEPGSLLLIGSGVVGLMLVARRKMKN